MDIKKCCKPFPDLACSGKLFQLTESIIEKFKAQKCKAELNTTLKICDRCRRRAYKEEQSTTEPQPSTSQYDLEEVPSAASINSASSEASVAAEYSRAHNIELFNKGIAGINVSPISAKKTRNVNYPREKYLDISRGIKKQIFGFPADEEDPELLKTKAAELDEVITKMIEQFAEPDCTRNEKVRLLSVLPKSWSKEKIASQFKANKYIVSEARESTDEKTAKKPAGRSRNETIENEVLQYYNSDDVSRAMPGSRDYVTVKMNGKCERKQKRLLYSSLKEIYLGYKEEFPDRNIGFSSFAALRPKHCKLLGSSGSHNICVCTIHENVLLMIHAVEKYFKHDDKNYYLKKLLCDSPKRSCYLRECQSCPSTQNLERSVLDNFEERDLTEIRFEQWVSTDRCDLEKFVKPVEEFVAYFCEKLEKLVTHDFIKNQQSDFLKKAKSNLKTGEIVVICDFSENFSFVLQDAVQSHYWSNDQATIHPFEIYYRESGELKHLSFIVISEVLKHDTIAVQVFISHLMSFLKDKIQIKKAIFMSDGAASQYKNRKNFASLCKFKSMYKIEAEWHFFATSHGKGPCDALGGNLKRMARRESLAKLHEHPITTAKQLYEWAEKRRRDAFTTMSFCYVSQEEYELGVNKWSSVYQDTKMIPGTQKYHSFVPISETTIVTRLYSNDNARSTHTIFKNLKP